MIRTIVCALLFVIGAGPCAADPIRVVTSTSDLAALTFEIGGDAVAVTCLAPPNLDPHKVPVKPSMIRAVKDARLVLAIGLDHDSWFDELLEASDNPNVQKGTDGYLAPHDGIELITQTKRMLIDESVPLHVHKMGNTHYWLDPRNANRMSKHIAAALARLVPDEKAAILRRSEAVHAATAARIDAWQKRLAKLDGVPIVAYHDTWAYLEQFGKFQIIGLVESGAGVPPSPAHLAKLTTLMKEKQARIILMADYEDRSRVEALASDTGSRIVQVGPSVPGGATYVDHFESIVRALEQAISPEPK